MSLSTKWGRTQLPQCLGTKLDNGFALTGGHTNATPAYFALHSAISRYRTAPPVFLP